MIRCATCDIAHGKFGFESLLLLLVKTFLGLRGSVFSAAAVMLLHYLTI